MEGIRLARKSSFDEDFTCAIGTGSECDAKTKDVYGQTLLELENKPGLVVLDADLSVNKIRDVRKGLSERFLTWG